MKFSSRKTISSIQSDFSHHDQTRMDQSDSSSRENLLVPQHWMSFFNWSAARRLTPESCHYEPMGIYDVPDHFDPSPMGGGRWINSSSSILIPAVVSPAWGRAQIFVSVMGDPVNSSRLLHRDENELVVEYETGWRQKSSFIPIFITISIIPWKMRTILNAYLGRTHPTPNVIKVLQWIKRIWKRRESMWLAHSMVFSPVCIILMEYPETLMNLIEEPDLIYSMTERLGEWNLTLREKWSRREPIV